MSLESKAISYITDSIDLSDLNQRYRKSVKFYPELKKNNLFQRTYDMLRDQYVPKIQRKPVNFEIKDS